MAVNTCLPEAPTISPTANAAGTTGALGCSEESAWVSSKSREWPSAPLSSAATAGVQVLLSPNTVDSPLASKASASSMFNSDGVDSASPRPDSAAEKIQRQHLGARQHLLGDVLEFQVDDVSGERCGFIGHGVASFVLARSRSALLVRLPRRAVNISCGGSAPCFPSARSAGRCGPARRTARSRR